MYRFTINLNGKITIREIEDVRLSSYLQSLAEFDAKLILADKPSIYISQVLFFFNFDDKEEVLDETTKIRSRFLKLSCPLVWDHLVSRKNNKEIF